MELETNLQSVTYLSLLILFTSIVYLYRSVGVYLYLYVQFCLFYYVMLLSLGVNNTFNSIFFVLDLYAFIIGSYVIWTVVTWCFSFDVWVVAGCLYHKNAPFESSKSVVDKDANTKKKNKSTDRSTASTAPLNKGMILHVTKSLNTFNILTRISFLLILL